MSYKIIRKYTIDNLEHAVNMQIKEGWKPLGGFVLEKLTGQLSLTAIYYQTMTKELSHDRN